MRDAATHVPMYRERTAPGDIGADVSSMQEMLSTFPVLTKADVMSTPADARIDERFAGRRRITESTTGSTGQPFSLVVDPAYLRRRNLRFLRALVAVGYRPWQRFMLLTDRYTRPTRKLGTRYYESVEQPTASMLAAYLRIRPAALYGFTTSLRLLRDELPAGVDVAHSPAFVISTAEVLDAATRSSLESGFGCPVYDFYGMTEMGLVAWQHPRSDGRYAVSDSVVVELEPVAAGSDLHRVILTNLDLAITPFIRYDSGDLAVIAEHDGNVHITAFEGRRLDTIVLRDGSELSPYRITDALRDVPHLARFKVLQESLDRVRVDVEIDPAAFEGACADIRGILSRLLGDDVHVECRRQSTLLPAGARKFRPVESRVARNR